MGVNPCTNVQLHNHIPEAIMMSERMVLETPHLCFCEAEHRGHFKALGSGQVFIQFELTFEFQQLLTGESRAWPARLAQQTVLRSPYTHIMRK